MLSAANALHIFLCGERGMPRQDLEAVKPAVLDHQEPSCVAKGVEAANGASRASCDWVIHRVPFDNPSSADCGAGKEAWTRVFAQGHGQHSKVGIETKREMR